MLHTYVCAIDHQVAIDFVDPPERYRYIISAHSEQVRLERWYVWKLLEVAMMRSLQYSFQEIKFKRTQSGKWTCDKCCFSLSHTSDAVALALSDVPVGIDIERSGRVPAALARRILTADEMLEYNKPTCQSDFLTMVWTQKESLYKMNGESAFGQSTLDFASILRSSSVTICDSSFCISCANQDVRNQQLYLLEKGIERSPAIFIDR